MQENGRRMGGRTGRKMGRRRGRRIVMRMVRMTDRRRAWVTILIYSIAPPHWNLCELWPKN